MYGTCGQHTGCRPRLILDVFGGWGSGSAAGRIELQYDGSLADSLLSQYQFSRPGYQSFRGALRNSGSVIDGGRAPSSHMAQYMGRGKAMRALSRARPRLMRAAALSACMRNGIG